MQNHIAVGDRLAPRALAGSLVLLVSLLAAGHRISAAPTEPGQDGGTVYRLAGTWRGLNAPTRIEAAPDTADLAVLMAGGTNVGRFGADGTLLGATASFGLSEIAVGNSGNVFAIRDLSVVRLGPAGYDMWSDRIQGEFHPQIGERLPYLAALGWDPIMARATVIFDRDTTLSLAYGLAGNRYDGLTLTFPTHVYWDIDFDATRGYVLNRSTNNVEIFEGGSVVGLVPLPARAERIAVGPGDRLFVLVERRWVYALDVTSLGAGIIDVWEATDPEPGALLSEATDLTVDGSGRVYVADPVRGQVRVYEPDAGTRPGPPPGPRGPGCQTVPNKTASPTYLWLGEKTQVTLRLDGSCEEVAERADIVLVVDRSESMNYEEGRKIAAARQSLLAFLGLVDLRRDQVALVSFASESRLDVGLTQDRWALESAAAALEAGGGTDIAEALDLALQALRGPNRRPDAKPIVVLMTDGVPFDTSALRAVAARDRLRHGDIALSPQLADRHVALYTIGLGDDVNPDLLRAVASSEELYYFAPDAGDLEAVYRTIARRIFASVLLEQVTIVDHVPGNMTYQVGSAVPPAVWDSSARTLTWAFQDVPFTGIEMTYWLEPQLVGQWPTNVRADYDGTDGLEQPQRGPFPIPRVVVVAPTITPSPTVPATVTTTATTTAPPTAPPTASAPPSATASPGASPTSIATATSSATPSATVTLPPGVTPTATAPLPTPTHPTASPTPTRYTIYVIIVFNGACFQRYTDVSLVIDASTTMLEPSENGRVKLDEAKEAARTFLSRLQLEPDRHGRHDQASIIWYNDTAAVEQPLTNDRAALTAAIDRIRPVEGSRIDLGLELGHHELLPHVRPNRRLDNAPALVLLSDGLPNRVPTPVAPEPRPQEETIVTIADRAKADAITIFAVGYGRRVHEQLMRRVASQPENYYYAPDGAELERIYHTIAGELVCR